MLNMKVLLGSLLASIPLFVNAQLSGGVGPLTSASTKAATKVCNIVDYGAKAGTTTDVGPPIASAWAACASGGLVYIPPGTYQMETWVNLKDASKIAIQLDGIIERTGTAGGTMFGITSASDFEFFSGTSKGAIQGYGYEFISKGTYGPRLLRFTSCTDFSLHGIALVDSPSYYVSIVDSTNVEVYNMISRGITIGETDGYDISGSNIWVHDVEVTNGDECVTVKNTASNFLVENVHCNQSGGCSIGSLALDTSITLIHYNHIYENNAGGHYIKSYGGSGTVSDSLFENFIVHNSGYTLTNNEYWDSANNAGGPGVFVTGLTYRDWSGTNEDNSRPVVRYQCADTNPCTDIVIENVNIWTTDGDYVTWECESAYGTGACLRDASDGAKSYAASFSTLSTVKSWSATTMPNDHTTPFPSTTSFTIPPVPTTFFPGLTPISRLLSLTTYAKREEVTPEVTPVPFKV